MHQKKEIVTDCRQTLGAIRAFQVHHMRVEVATKVEEEGEAQDIENQAFCRLHM